MGDQSWTKNDIRKTQLGGMVEPHEFRMHGPIRRRQCVSCYLPKSKHPTTKPVVGRVLGEKPDEPD